MVTYELEGRPCRLSVMKGLAGVDTISIAIEGIAAASDGPDDPLSPARTVRRALADAGLKATEVTSIVVSEEATVSQGGPEGFARRALGPTGEVVAVRTASAGEVVRHACLEATRQPGVTVALLHRERTTLALCLRARSRPGEPAANGQSIVK